MGHEGEAGDGRQNNVSSLIELLLTYLLTDLLTALFDNLGK